MDDEAKRYIAELEGKVQLFTERVPVEAIERIVWGEATEQDYTEVEEWLEQFAPKEERP